ncbi:MAG TPA: hypothetical protein V6D33_07120 [Cyanophyceae cyanobacterium]
MKTRENSIKGIAVKQPYAWALLNGKGIENRTKPFHYSGLLLIHASKKVEPWYWNYGVEVCQKNGLTVPPKDQLFFGGLIGVVDMTGCTYPKKVEGWGMSDHWHWHVGNPRTFKTPIPYVGKLWTMDIDLTLAEINALVAGEPVNYLGSDPLIQMFFEGEKAA